MTENIPGQSGSKELKESERLKDFKDAAAKQEAAFESLKSEEGRYLGDATLRLTKASMGEDLEQDV